MPLPRGCFDFSQRNREIDDSDEDLCSRLRFSFLPIVGHINRAWRGIVCGPVPFVCGSVPFIFAFVYADVYAGAFFKAEKCKKTLRNAVLFSGCPLYPRKRTCAVHSSMSALGQ
jgi:hypothetical protein